MWYALEKRKEKKRKEKKRKENKRKEKKRKLVRALVHVKPCV